jgi:glycine/D-amino acid oxidase-like deaminating enzyme
VATSSYWLSEPLAQLPRGADSGDCDVVIVGGGVTGCACALTLAAAGRAVRLLEAGIVAGGASGRNGGFALRGAAPAYDEVRASLGAEQAGALWQLSERTLARIAELAGDAFRPVGSLRLASDAGERDALAREYDALRGDGFAALWQETLSAPLDRLYAGAILHPPDGALDPARWVRTLALRAAAAGAALVEQRPVDPEELAGFDDAAVVVAVDGSTAALLPELAALVRPVRGQMLATEPLSERLFARPHYARGGYDYWQQLPDGRLVLGGRRDTDLAAERSSRDETTPLIQDELDALARELLGVSPRVTHRWAGVWGETADRLPLAGRLPGHERLWIASGYSGHGNVLGFACGELVARAILGEQPAELALFNPARLLARPESRRQGAQGVAPRVGVPPSPTQAGHQ